jgi:hypothetical protein
VSDARGPDRVASRVGLAVATVAALLQLAPVLLRGYVLVQDMVIVPRQPWTGALLGLDGVPRQVPSDLLVAVTSRVVPAWLVQDVVLVAVFVLAGWGCARLVPGSSRVAAAVAAAIAAWCPWPAERLLLGQWALLLGYAALPWALRAVLDLRDSENRGARRRLLSWLLLAALGGAAAEVVVLLPCLVLALVMRRPRVAARVVLAGALLAVPWLVPSLLLPGGIPDSAQGVQAFASQADTPFRVWGSVATLGGIWNRLAVPPSRDTWAGATLTLAVVVAAVVTLARRRDDLSRGLLVAGGIGWLVAVASATPGLRVLAKWAVLNLPGGGLLRDAQKWALPLVPMVAVGAGLAAAAGVGWVAARSPRQVATGAAVVATLVPLAALPGIAWGTSGRLHAVSWPGDWQRVRTLVDRDPRPGAVAALPWAAYRTFPWNDHRLQADPATRWLPRRTAVDDRLLVGRRDGGVIVVPGEDRWAAAVTAALARPGPATPRLAALGIGWVLVERTTPGGADVARLFPDATVVYRGTELTLLALAVRPRPLDQVAVADSAPFGPVLAADLGALALFVTWSALSGHPLMSRGRPGGGS